MFRSVYLYNSLTDYEVKTLASLILEMKTLSSMVTKGCVIKSGLTVATPRLLLMLLMLLLLLLPRTLADPLPKQLCHLNRLVGRPTSLVANWSERISWLSHWVAGRASRFGYCWYQTGLRVSSKYVVFYISLVWCSDLSTSIILWPTMRWNHWPHWSWKWKPFHRW